ncbi:MAG: DUF2298 domain-containing protein, partial [Chloroflexaceae bacterium]|nr:DUF2298 domain-containing protein [Chloroflexaceae bacterium]
MFFEIFRWWLVIQALGLLALPLTNFLFRFLPDRGYAFSKAFGLLLTGYGAWLIAMLGIAPFGAPLLAVVALAVGVAGWLATRTKNRESRTEGNKRDLVLGSWFSVLSWRTLLAYELLFLGALLFLVWMRSHDLGFVGPNPWGTERPMDLAFFNAIQHSANFPPNDPWLAGFSINYYYFGYMLMAVMALLSGVTGGAGYNLSLALIFALTALGIAGVILNLIRLYEAKNREPVGANLFAQPENREPAPLNPPHVGEVRTENRLTETPSSMTRGRGFLSLANVGAGAAVLLALVFVLFAANQFGALQVLVGSERVVALDGGQLGAAVGQALGGAPTINLPSPVNTLPWDWGSFQTLERGDRVNDFNWWWPSRALWDEVSVADPNAPAPTVRRYNITEFPFFSFWLGDMHPHVMSLPFVLLALALALNTLVRPAAPTFTLNRAGWMELLLTGLLLGSLYTINSWDLPTYILLYAGALALLYWRFAEGRFEQLLWQPLLQQLAMVALTAFVLFAPFHLTFRSFAGGAAATSLPIIGGLTRVIGLYTGERSGLHAFLIIFGLFLLPLLAFVYILRRELNQPHGADSSQQLALIARTHPSSFILHPSKLLPLLPPVLLVVGLLLGFPLLALLGLGLLAGWLAMRLVNRPVESFGLLVVALGCAIAFGTELIFIRDTFDGRMNTIFKFYYQIWLLWGVLAAFGTWWLLKQTGATQTGDGRRETGVTQTGDGRRETGVTQTGEGRRETVDEIDTTELARPRSSVSRPRSIAVFAT